MSTSPEFKKRGGKYIQWHGLADPLVTALGSIEYYRRVVAAQGGAGGVKKAERTSGALDDRALANAQDFYRSPDRLPWVFDMRLLP